MYSKLRKMLRENREKPIIGLIYRRLKLYEKKRLLKANPPKEIVDVKSTKEIYREEISRLQLVDDYIHGRTLDVGSKFGLVTKGTEIVALDIVRDHLRLNVHADRVLADARNLPFAENSFSTVVATEILEHLEHPEDAVREANRVLKENGQVVISVPNRFNYFSEPTHIHYFTETKICNLFRDFQVVVCKPISTGHIFGVFKAIK